MKQAPTADWTAAMDRIIQRRRARKRNEEYAARRSVLDLIDAAHQTVRLLEQVVGGDTGDARQVRWVLGGEIGQQLRSATDRALLCWVRQSSAAESRRA